MNCTIVADQGSNQFQNGNFWKLLKSLETVPQEISEFKQVQPLQTTLIDGS